jgi:hypothetical protein
MSVAESERWIPSQNNAISGGGLSSLVVNVLGCRSGYIEAEVFTTNVSK